MFITQPVCSTYLLILLTGTSGCNLKPYETYLPCKCVILSFLCNIFGFSYLYECTFAGKGKAKKAKHAPAVEPLEEGEEVTDTTGKKWKLVKLLSQSTTEVIYEGEISVEILECAIKVLLS